eukprot:1140807-Pelagomonas_calceolata.AAC.5
MLIPSSQEVCNPLFAALLAQERPTCAGLVLVISITMQSKWTQLLTHHSSLTVRPRLQKRKALFQKAWLCTKH